MTPQELLEKRNEVAQLVRDALWSVSQLQLSEDINNVHTPVAVVDLGDGFSVEVLVQPQMVGLQG